MDRRHILIVIARSLIYLVQFCMNKSSSGNLQEIPPSLSCLRLEDLKSLVGSCLSLQREPQLWALTIWEDLPSYKWMGLYWILRGTQFSILYSAIDEVVNQQPNWMAGPPQLWLHGTNLMQKWGASPCFEPGNCTFDTSCPPSHNLQAPIST